MRSFLAVLARGFAAAVIVGAALTAHAASTTQLKGWRDGPAGALLKDDEYRRFGELKTDDERRTFIDRFWAALEAGSDASHSFRETFEQRCATVDARYGALGREGWRTDRGRVYLSLGEPAAIRHEPGGVSAIEKEIWSYGASTGTEPPLEIVFYRCNDGGYRLDPSCSIERDPTSVAYDGERADFFRKLRDDNAATASGRLLGMLNGILLPVPGGVPLSRPTSARSGAQSAAAGGAALGPEASKGVHALESATYFFRAQDGTVLTLLTLELTAPRSEDGGVRTGEEPGLFGAASVEETGRRGEDLPETSARPVELGLAPGGKGGGAAFFGRVYLEAGRTYAVRYAVKDEAREEMFVRDALLGVPDLRRGFSTSSIVPAEDFGPAGPGVSRFRIGSEEVVPKAGGVFHRSELLRLYLQVYDAAIDPETSNPRVDVVFRFYRSVKNGAKRHGKPFSVRGATGASMGLALPIGDWPPGPYRVVVELHDRVAEARTTAEGAFTIAAE